MSCRLLILEPDRLLAATYEEFFQNSGYMVDAAQNAQAGILAADKNRPDLVIVELLLAGHSGIEFLYEFRSYPEWQNIPAILFSNVPEHELKINDATFTELGIKLYLYKPTTTLKKLASQVADLLQITPKVDEAS